MWPPLAMIDVSAPQARPISCARSLEQLGSSALAIRRAGKGSGSIGTGAKPCPSGSGAASSSGGATRNAPAVFAGSSNGAACTTARTPQLWATSTGGLVAAATAATMRSTQSVQTGLSQSACSTRRAVLKWRCQRDCQWSGPELVQPGTIRMSTSEVRISR